MAEAAYPHLSSPPIHEAVFDIRVKAQANLAIDGLEPLRNALSARFPSVENLEWIRATFAVEKGKEAKAQASEKQRIGLLFKSEDGKLIFQARMDGITLSRLKPYTSFDELFPLFMECWSAYVAATQPIGVMRTAMRFINRIEAPASGDLEDHLHVIPSVPVEGGILQAFEHRAIYKLENSPLSAVVGLALEPAIDGRSCTVVIDIDAFSDNALETTPELLAAAFGELRDLKNRIFFSILSPRARERFA